MENNFMPAISLLVICLVCLLIAMGGVKKFLDRPVFKRNCSHAGNGGFF